MKSPDISGDKLRLGINGRQITIATASNCEQGTFQYFIQNLKKSGDYSINQVSESRTCKREPERVGGNGNLPQLRSPCDIVKEVWSSAVVRTHAEFLGNWSSAYVRR